MSVHWYKMKTGECAYTTIGANGLERDTTLRDARKHGYVPSVTTIISGAASPGLDMYLQTQLLNAAISVYAGDKTEEEWRRAVVKESREHSKKAAEAGSKIHDALEHYYLGENPTGDMLKIITPVVNFMKQEFGYLHWRPERSFGSNLGFGGKVDMSYSSDDGERCIILDFKTKATSDIKKMIPYDQHHMQTAAYAVGLDMPHADRYNLFISTETPGLINLTKSDNFERDWGMFEALLKYWQLKNKYNPGVE